MKAANIGKILGGFGLLLLFSSPFTLFFSSGSFALVATKVVAGLVLVGLYFATNFKQFGQFASRRSSFFFGSTALMVLLTLGALLAINYIAYKKNQRWDLTEKKIFTLSPQTLSTLKGLREPVRAIGFIPTDHPAYEALQATFDRYHVEAPERFEYSFKDPRRHPDLTEKYSLTESQTTVVLTRGEGSSETHTKLNIVSEQELTNALIKLTRVSEQKVYFVVGHGEWPLNQPMPMSGQRGRTTSLSEMKQQLTQEGYSTREINLAGGTTVPRDASLVVIAGAKGRYSPSEVESLRQYLAAGGRMIYFAEAYGEPGPELSGLLAEYGVGIDPGVVADAQFNGGSPYVVLSLFYGRHEISQPLSQRQLNIEFPTARALNVRTLGLAEGVKVVAVVSTSPFGWVELTPDDKPAAGEGERTGQIPLVTASTRNTSGAQDKRFDEARLVVVGDSELLMDSNWGHEGNRNLVMNAFGWATTQEDKVTIRPPDRTASTLQLDEDMLNRVRFVSTDVLPLSLLGVGMAIWLSRRNK
ncbi:GldG family protein [Archangium lansingense]|uniref:GldG family protein n=1 Tax=Archangium lansingense TaxID=2995310 RepID=A0ABT4AE08_9BACT|nr:GldG family protein [Archangium lansinium]MCY1079903.1 GldG family protein [Archangium lansinium]